MADTDSSYPANVKLGQLDSLFLDNLSKMNPTSGVQ